VTIVAGDAALAEALAARFVAAAQRAVAERGRFAVALSGGTTPAAAFEVLAQRHAGDVEWSAVHVFWGDERPVPPDHPDSNYRMASEHLLRQVPIPEGQIHRMRGEAADLDAAAAEYGADLAQAFGIAPGGPPPVFDLVLLGMGPEGHTASLFPDAPALGAQGWVEAPFVPQLGMRRITLTPRVINAARRVIFAVGGQNKAAALKAVLATHADPERYPARVVAPVHGALEWLVEHDLAVAAGVES
jgi:6-phosphogluconolactonase